MMDAAFKLRFRTPSGSGFLLSLVLVRTNVGTIFNLLFVRHSRVFATRKPSPAPVTAFLGVVPGEEAESAAQSDAITVGPNERLILFQPSQSSYTGSHLKAWEAEILNQRSSTEHHRVRSLHYVLLRVTSWTVFMFVFYHFIFSQLRSRQLRLESKTHLNKSFCGFGSLVISQVLKSVVWCVEAEWLHHKDKRTCETLNQSSDAET